MNLWFDVKFAWRVLKKSWGFALMCASVVALSVGLAVWTYALAYSQLWKPLEFPDSDRWYSIQIAPEAGKTAKPTVDAYTWQELLKQKRAADHLGAFASESVVLSEGQASTTLRAALITPRLLAATRVPPHLGRSLQDSDGQPGGAAVAVLSFDTWQTYFAGDPSIVGKAVRIDSAPVQIAGVMPKDFYAFKDFELWMPLQVPQLVRPQDSAMTLSPIVLLHGGQSTDALVGEMKPVVERINREHRDVFKDTRNVKLISAHKMYKHSATPIISMIALMAAAVLLLGCVNISMVFLARLLERSRELALRTALGASPSRLLRQSLVETALVVLAGLVVGYALAVVGIRWTQGISDLSAQVLATGRGSGRLALRSVDLIAAVISATAIWLLSTLIPAWRIARQDAAQVLAGSGKGASVRVSNKSAGLLVGLQVVISSLVLAIAGNVVLAVRKEVNKPIGLNTAQVVVSTYPTVLDKRFPEPEQRLQYWNELSAAIGRTIPGAEVVFATAIPTRPEKTPVAVETQEGASNQGTLTRPLTVVSENYFALLGIRLRSGRLFDSTDNSESLKVAIVDETMASRYWPGQEVIGKRLQLNPADNGSWLTIVGVVAAVAGKPYDDEEQGIIYRPLRQAAPSGFHLLVKTPNAATDSRAALRAAAFTVDRDLPLHNLQTLDDYLTAMNLTYGGLTTVLIAVALITALLAASGLFGLISRSVAQRTQEVGIRRALGATPWRAISMFLKQGALYLGISIVGVGLGIMVMPALSRSVDNIFDRVVLATLGVVLFMAFIIFSASYLPTRRALTLEPGDALRYE